MKIFYLEGPSFFKSNFAHQARGGGGGRSKALGGHEVEGHLHLETSPLFPSKQFRNIFRAAGLVQDPFV